ncbi:MAG TPA: ASCH domain-containing protein [Ilumatobacter sp.]|nr:ASCH domain-containing protein [Ilumatobacter sp.]
MTELSEPDEAQVAAFWERAIAAGVVLSGTPAPELVEPFGDSVELADELIGLVVDGPKRATAGALADHESSGEPLPFVGMLSIATDGQGRARALLRTTDVRIGPLSSVDDAFAWDEGEGDRTRADWLAAHTGYFQRYLPTIGVVFDADMPTVFERFEVLYSE